LPANDKAPRLARHVIAETARPIGAIGHTNAATRCRHEPLLPLSAPDTLHLAHWVPAKTCFCHHGHAKAALEDEMATSTQYGVVKIPSSQALSGAAATASTLSKMQL